MKLFEIRYENCGECLYTTVAMSLNSAVRHFHEDVGFYHIYSVTVRERAKENANKQLSGANQG